MPYPPRFNFPGAVYHVTDRGAGPCALFHDAEDHDRFNWTLGVNLDRYGWRVLMWVHMTTHVHLLLQTPFGNLPPGMQRLKSVYAQGFNRKYGRKGALFGERYSCWFIQSDAHFFRTVRYIAQNPVEAGLCARPEDFRWSSYGSTLRGARPYPANAAAELVQRCGGTEALKRLVDLGYEAEAC